VWGIDLQGFDGTFDLRDFQVQKVKRAGIYQGRTHIWQKEKEARRQKWLCAWWQDTDDIARSNERTNEQAKADNTTGRANSNITARPEERGQHRTRRWVQRDPTKQAFNKRRAISIIAMRRPSSSWPCGDRQGAVGLKRWWSLRNGGEKRRDEF
jgi:hypothetical protein